MANSIALADKYIPVIDEKYSVETKSAVLERPDFVRYFDGANAVQILSIATQALGDYGRNTGYVDGNITATWETHTLSQDRGRRFLLDAMDNEETLGLTLGGAMSEFMKQDVSPEIDAYRFAVLASKAGNSATATLSASTAKQAIDVGRVAMKEAKVNLDGGFLFATPTVVSYLENSNFFTYNLDASADQNRGGAIGKYRELTVVEVPQTQFYTAITQYDGSTTGETEGGYIKNASTGKDMNFLIVASNACLPVIKHNPSNIISPTDNQTADSHIMKYRLYHDIFVPANKVNGVYYHSLA